MRLNPLRDGTPGGLFLDVVLPGGKVLDSGLPKNGTPVNVPRGLRRHNDENDFSPHSCRRPAGSRRAPRSRIIPMRCSR